MHIEGLGYNSRLTGSAIGLAEFIHTVPHQLYFRRKKMLLEEKERSLNTQGSSHW